MIQPLRVDPRFNPCPVEDGDELFPNGIFVFNVSRMLAYLDQNPTDVELVEIAVCHLDQGFSVLNESHVDSVDLSRPVVLAEISPGQYNLIDGHHRVEKALRHGLITLHAYRLTIRQQNSRPHADRGSSVSPLDILRGILRHARPLYLP
jgi:hypothetical protein